VDEVLCLGDVAVGPQPVETLERLQELGCPVVMGNWDSYFVSGFPEQKSEFSRKLLEMGEWWAGKLSHGHREYIESFEESLERPLDNGKRLLAFHGSPRSFDDFIYCTTPDEELERMLEGACEHLLAAERRHATLWVLESDDRARGFYEHLGWRPDGARQAGPSTDIRYRRALA